ncbi:MAG: hypothetical protein ABIQ88_08760 [Chitinophagaceae bacterium]
MKIFLWSILVLLLIGDAFFVIPYHFSKDTVITNYAVHYKKDSLLLKNVFPDSAIQLNVNMPPLYEMIFKAGVSTVKKADNPSRLFVNVSISHNLDFTALSVPFYKVTTFNGIIPFYSIIKASNIPDMDSTALVGHISINGKLLVKGICTPLYARTLVEKELVAILKREMNKVELDINRRPVADTLLNNIVPVIQKQSQSKKKKK